VISQKRCNDIGGRYSGGTVFCALVEELCEFMSARYRLGGLKIVVFAISKLCAAYQILRSLPGKSPEFPNLFLFVGARAEVCSFLYKFLHTDDGRQVRVTLEFEVFSGPV